MTCLTDAFVTFPYHACEKPPHGTSGVLGNESVELIDGLPSEAVSLMQDYLIGQIGTMEFASRAEAIRKKNSNTQLSRPET